MAAPTKGPYALVTEQEWKSAVAAAAPTRPDDTVVLSGDKRATLKEVQAYVAEDLARRAAEARWHEPQLQDSHRHEHPHPPTQVGRVGPV